MQERTNGQSTAGRSHRRSEKSVGKPLIIDSSLLFVLLKKKEAIKTCTTLGIAHSSSVNLSLSLIIWKRNSGASGDDDRWWWKNATCARAFGWVCVRHCLAAIHLEGGRKNLGFISLRKKKKCILWAKWMYAYTESSERARLDIDLFRPIIMCVVCTRPMPFGMI